MRDHDRLFTIGELAERTGLSVRTIRFWSDADIVPPTGRTGTGYRLYDTESVARIDLVKTLRDLGMDLATVRAVLEEQVTIADVAAAHAKALGEEIRTLKTHRAVLASVAQRDGTSEEMRIMHELAKLSAAQRRRLLEEFVAEAFEGADPESPGAGIAERMRRLPTELPDEPTTEQVDAWIELAELVRDPEFRARCRQMALAGAERDQTESPVEHERVLAVVTSDVVDGTTPDSSAAAEVLADLGVAGLSAEQKHEAAEVIEMFSDHRVERYWQLWAVLNGYPSFSGSRSSTAAYAWLVAALRAAA